MRRIDEDDDRLAAQASQVIGASAQVTPASDGGVLAFLLAVAAGFFAGCSSAWAVPIRPPRATSSATVISLFIAMLLLGAVSCIRHTPCDDLTAHSVCGVLLHVTPPCPSC